MSSVFTQIVGASVRIGARFLVEPSQLNEPLLMQGWDDLDGPGLASNRRILRADVPTRLCALLSQQAIGDGHGLWAGERVGLVTASVSASARTNEGYELRRLDGHRAEARAFAYTAPNAALGELSTALGAKGPSMAVVGGMEAGLIALHRACRWIAEGRVERIVLVAQEVPTQHNISGWSLIPCGACLLLCAAESVESKQLRVHWDDARNEMSTARLPHGAADAIIALSLAYLSGRDERVRVVPEQGAALVASLGANRNV